MLDEIRKSNIPLVESVKIVLDVISIMLSLPSTQCTGIEIRFLTLTATS